jgi:hypothetical protein
MLSAEELMSPRYEVIALYPKCPFKIGDVLVRIKLNEGNWYHTNKFSFSSDIKEETIKDYPHLFKKLNWWEHRSEDDMPKKVICKAIPGDQEVLEVFRWDMKMLFGFEDEKTRTGVDLTCFVPEHGYFPVD